MILNRRRRAPIRYATTMGAVVALLATWACGGTAGESGARGPARTATADSVTVVFTKDEAPAPVRRPSPDTTAPLRTAMEWLVQGPTPEERAAGIRSWFSEATAGVLRGVEVDSAGLAIIDFQDLRPLIPNASSSFGSTMLLQELNGTVFQFPEIHAVEYRMAGSCDLFWEWLQYGCHLEKRPE